MNGSGVYTFQMHWLTMVWLAVLGVILGGLLFAAGMVTGTRTTLASLEQNGGANQLASTSSAPPSSVSLPASTSLAQQPPATAAAPPVASTVPPVTNPAPASKVPAPQTPSQSPPQPVPQKVSQTALAGAASPKATAPTTVAPTAPSTGTESLLADLSSPRAFLDTENGAAPMEDAVTQENILLPGGWAVQLGAFVVEENADELVAELMDRGYEPYIHRMRTTGGKPLHSVRLWSFSERQEAWKEASKFSQREAMPASVIRSPTD